MVDISEVFKKTGTWLKAADLNKQKHRVTIESVEVVDFGKDGKEDKKLGVHFVNRSMGLICNKTNADTIAYLNTPDTDNWIGQDIILYPTMVDFGGRSVEAIRVELPMEEAPPFEPQSPEPRQVPPSPYPEQAADDFESDIPF